MRVLRIPLVILSIVLLFTTAIGLHYATARTGESKLCLYYMVVHRGQNGNYYPFETYLPILADPYTGKHWTDRRASSLNYRIPDYEFSPDGQRAFWFEGVPTNGNSVEFTYALKIGQKVNGFVQERGTVVLDYMVGKGALWSPDGNRVIAVHIDSKSHRMLTLFNADGSNIRQRMAYIDQPTAPSELISWSPDGRYFVTSTVVKEIDRVVTEKVLIVWNADTLQAVSTTPRVIDQMVYWSPDSNAIAYLSDNGTSQGNALNILRLETGEQHHFDAPGTYVYGRVRWSPDSQWVLVNYQARVPFNRDSPYRRTDYDLHSVHGYSRWWAFHRVGDAEFHRDMWAWTPDSIIYNYSDRLNLPLRYDITRGIDQWLDMKLNRTDYVYSLPDPGTSELTFFYLQSDLYLQSNLERQHTLYRYQLDGSERVALLTELPESTSVHSVTNGHHLILSTLPDRATKYGPLYLLSATQTSPLSIDTLSDEPLTNLRSGGWSTDGELYYFTAEKGDSGGRALFALEAAALKVRKLTPFYDQVAVYGSLTPAGTPIVHLHWTHGDKSGITLFTEHATGIASMQFDQDTFKGAIDEWRPRFITVTAHDSTASSITMIMSLSTAPASGVLPFYLIHSEAGKTYATDITGYDSFTVLNPVDRAWNPEFGLLVFTASRQLSQTASESRVRIIDRYGQIVYDGSVLTSPDDFVNPNEAKWIPCRQ